jgi:hypothetical protein
MPRAGGNAVFLARTPNRSLEAYAAAANAG